MIKYNIYIKRKMSPEIYLEKHSDKSKKLI